jgi:hypothetical protein
VGGPDIVVFVGSSLGAADRRLVAAAYQPPAQQGDVLEAAEVARPRAIAIVDGLFHDVPAVRHREILWALRRGVQVFGASSMGALRAAELAHQGMIGVGLIYRWYRGARLAGDDEVAQALGPAELGFRPLSEALVEMRLTLRRAERAGVISRYLRRRLEAVAKGLFYRDRSYGLVLDLARRTAAAVDGPGLDRLAAWLPAHRVERKRLDALALMRRLAAGAWRTRPPAPPGELADTLTGAWLRDLRHSGLAHLIEVEGAGPAHPRSSSPD